MEASEACSVFMPSTSPSCSGSSASMTCETLVAGVAAKVSKVSVPDMLAAFIGVPPAHPVLPLPMLLLLLLPLEGV